MASKLTQLRCTIDRKINRPVQITQDHLRDLEVILQDAHERNVELVGSGGTREYPEWRCVKYQVTLNNNAVYDLKNVDEVMSIRTSSRAVSTRTESAGIPFAVAL